MILWIEWYDCIQYLHAACSRTTSAMCYEPKIQLDRLNSLSYDHFDAILDHAERQHFLFP